MRIEALECFHEVMKSGSIRQAASNRYITQQGLSKIIQSLEAELGTRLFQKSGRNVTPTQEALLLDEYAKVVIDGYKDLMGRLKDVQTEEAPDPDSEMVLCATPFVGNGLFNLLQEEMDELQIGGDRLMIRELGMEAILESFQAGEVNLALLNIQKEDYLDLRDRFDPVMLFVSEVVLMVPPALAASIPGRTVTPESLNALPIACYSEEVLNRLFGRFSATAGTKQPRLLQHSTNIASIHGMVNSGRAVTFSDTFSLSVRNSWADAIPMTLDPPQWFVVCFLINPELEDSSPERRFVSRFKEMLYDNHGAYLRNAFVNY